MDVLDQVLKDLHHYWGQGHKVYAIAMHPDDLESIVSDAKNEAWWVMVPCDPSVTAICGIRVVTCSELFRGLPSYKLTPFEMELN